MALIEGLDEERSHIQAIDEHLTVTTGAVVDDVVMRAWGDEQIELTHLLLSAAITASGGVVDEPTCGSSPAVAFPAAARGLSASRYCLGRRRRSGAGSGSTL